MHAVIRTGGKQYRVSPGETIKVELLAGKLGSEVTFDDILAVIHDDKSVLLGTEASKARVTGKIVGQDRHPKRKVIKFKKTRQYKITRGHRQDFTAVQVSAIHAG
jgi:large subunit ribosomal protein L21